MYIVLSGQRIRALPVFIIKYVPERLGDSAGPMRCVLVRNQKFR